MTKHVHFVADVDIKGFFDNINHNWLIKFLEHDIQDRNFIRYIKRFLKSGIMDKGQYSDSDTGMPQGGLISPILANVYLHYVWNLWFEKAIKRESNGFTDMVRYADDFVCCFQKEADAQAFLVKLKERLAKFGLEIAANKCRIVRFGRFVKEKGHECDFLGFTYINGTKWDGEINHVHANGFRQRLKRAAGFDKSIDERYADCTPALVKRCWTA